ncbi:carbonic anhydrase [Bdellovibrio sp. HCB290]|uniref:carbonic anhydrase n=1 Tax=Bdellovibrio sp. HCB290 TaxID=3394356 RepID=UPI0039B6D9EC
MIFRVALLVAAMSLSACSLFQGRRAPNQEMQVSLKDEKGNVKPAPATATVTSADGKTVTPISPDADTGTAEDKARAQELREAVAVEAAKQAKKDAAPTTTAPSATPAGAKLRSMGPIPAEKSMGWLKNGNTRYVTGRLRADGASRKDRMHLTEGQKPHAIVLACSDSRVPPELVFDQKLGEIFVVRTAGDSLNETVVGSIEYGIQYLGANLIVVLGHSSCGAVNAALKGEDLGSPALNAIVDDIKPRITQFAGQTPSRGLVQESFANVTGVAHDLLMQSQILRDAVASGDVKISRALYHLDSGKVEWKD